MINLYAYQRLKNIYFLEFISKYLFCVLILHTSLHRESCKNLSEESRIPVEAFMVLARVMTSSQTQLSFVAL